MKNCLQCLLFDLELDEQGWGLWFIGCGALKWLLNQSDTEETFRNYVYSLANDCESFEPLDQTDG